MSQPFDSFMTQREAAARAYVSGDGSLVEALSVAQGQATFFDPGGGFTESAERVNEVNRQGARSFGPGGTTHFDVKDKGASDDLAFWTGYQIASVEREGKTVRMTIRITEIFRRDDGEWRMIHRHASMAKSA
jgi:ketosteroid isomerase-like protein